MIIRFRAVLWDKKVKNMQGSKGGGMDCYNFSVMVFAQLFFSKCMNKRIFPLDRKRWVIANGDLSIINCHRIVKSVLFAVHSFCNVINQV